MTSRASRAALCEKLVKGLSGFTVRLPGSFHGVDQAYKLLSCVRDCNIVVLTFSTLFGQIGNNTSVSIVNGVEEINAIAHYSPDGNRLEDVWDPLNRVTYYGFDEQTNLQEWIQSPGDTVATRTYYDYNDTTYKLDGISATTDTNLAMSVDYTYDNDYLSAITTPTTTYSFQYDAWGLQTQVKIGNTPVKTSHYHEEETNDRKNDLDAIDYGNNDRVEYEYDDKGRVVGETYVNHNIDIENDTDTVEYTFDSNGNLATREDSVAGRTRTYYYDFIDRLMKYTETGGQYNGQTYSHSVGYEYDKLNNLTQLVEVINGQTHTTSYTYDDDNRVTGFTSDGIGKDYTYDAYGRLSLEMISDNAALVLKRIYSYQDLRANEYTSAQVNGYSLVADGYSKNLHYTYDDNGNITKITEGSGENAPVIAEYTYDTANQLLSEVLPGQRKTVWTYDNAGNIQSRTEYAWSNGSWGTGTTVNYVYGDAAWGDLLRGYDDNAITYDAIGNPLSDGTWTYTWQHGRQLASMAKTGETWTYTYDADGLRTKRTNGTETWEYVYNGGQLVEMTKGNNTLYFTYDAAGNPTAMTLNGETTYYYATNLQGDIIAILDDDGEPVVEYTYDAWGNSLGIDPEENNPDAATLAALNPLRYRGYVYDSETGLYYLQSRYYNPEIGRFINADVFYATGQGFVGNNMFAYCNNNPKTFLDETGTRPVVGIGPYTQTKKEKDQSFAYMNYRSRGTSAHKNLSKEQQVFIATIAGEAMGENASSQKAVAHTIMNRYYEPRDAWCDITTVADVLVKGQYEGVGSEQYILCMNYLDNRDGTNAEYEALIDAVIPIYYACEDDFTNGAHFIFNINTEWGRAFLSDLQAQPSRYIQCGPFDGIDPNKFCMYRSIW